MFRILLILPFLLLPLVAFAQSGVVCNQYQSTTAPPQGYGAAWNTQTSARELLLSGRCSGGAGQPVTYTVGTGNSSHYVYKMGYFYTSVWQPFTMTGTFAQDSTDWLAGRGTFTNNNPPSQNYFWVGFVCQWSGTVWKCGCRDVACAQPMWQLQGVAFPSSGGTTGGTTGGGSGDISFLENWRTKMAASFKGTRNYIPLRASGTDVNSISYRVALSFNTDGDAEINRLGWVRPIDVNGDGKQEFLQVNGQRLVRVYDQSGRKLWQRGTAGGPVATGMPHKSGAAIWDFDGDGGEEIVYCWGNNLVMIDGATGNTIKSVAAPAGFCADNARYAIEAYFMESGTSPIILVNGSTGSAACPGGEHYNTHYAHTHAYDKNLNKLWDRVTCGAGHQTHGLDEDSDGKMEAVFVGRYKLSGTGNLLCTLTLPLTDHVDDSQIGDINPNNPGFEMAITSATTQGVFSARDCRKLWAGSVRVNDSQTVVIAELDTGIPGLEVVMQERPSEPGRELYFFRGTDGQLIKKATTFGTGAAAFKGAGSLVQFNINADNKGLEEVVSGNGSIITINSIKASANWLDAALGDGDENVVQLWGDARPEIIGWNGNKIIVGEQQ